MMKHLLFILALPLLAADPPTTRTMSAAQETVLLRALVVQKHAQVELLAYREERNLDSMKLRALEVRAGETGGMWAAALAAAQKADKAEGCAPVKLDSKGEWSCEAKN